ncbi:MAG: hypothetical protein FWF53_09215 [Candidatus Azobacteroides sp.]|nr:hypothetical protein [Candidatus Azobacteroides sp.]
MKKKILFLGTIIILALNFSCSKDDENTYRESIIGCWSMYADRPSYAGYICEFNKNSEVIIYSNAYGYNGDKKYQIELKAPYRLISDSIITIHNDNKTSYKIINEKLQIGRIIIETPNVSYGDVFKSFLSSYYSTIRALGTQGVFGDNVNEFARWEKPKNIISYEEILPVQVVYNEFQLPSLGYTYHTSSSFHYERFGVSDGFSGILLVVNEMGKTPFAYELCCPVEKERMVRVAPVDPNNSGKATTAKCIKCGATFNIADGTGSPISGTTHSLKLYKVTKNGSNYIITNQN